MTQSESVVQMGSDKPPALQAGLQETVCSPINPLDERLFSIQDIPVILVLWLGFLLYGAIAAPIPAVNEPHYLGKAKFYWNPSWCERDFFLQSPNAHSVFYATFGCVTRLLTLEQSAWCGRTVAMLLLAASWVALGRCLVGETRSLLIAAVVYLALASCGNFAGEWLVGGIEGKVVAYGLLFLSLACLIRGKLIMAGGLAGGGVSFHPVVGLWGIMACLGWSLFARAWFPQRTPSQGVSWNRVFAAIGLLVLLALPGMIPVLMLLAEPADAETKYAGTYLQVFYRLAHHLDPMRISWWAYAGYGVLILVWLWDWRATVAKPTPASSNLNQIPAATNRGWAWLHGVTLFAVLFAALGLLAGLGPRPPETMPYYAERMQFLKFYPFRVADLLLPVVVSWSCARWCEVYLLSARRNQVDSHWKSAATNFRWTQIVVAVVYVVALGRAYWTADVNRYSGELRAEWLDACQWIKKNLPDNAMVMAPHNGWAFKWFAQRAEFVAFKDCPQDARGMVEWNRRLRYLRDWHERCFADQVFTVAELSELRRDTGMTHILAFELGHSALKPIYDNGAFQVYDLTNEK